GEGRVRRAEAIASAAPPRGAPRPRVTPTLGGPWRLRGARGPCPTGWHGRSPMGGRRARRRRRLTVGSAHAGLVGTSGRAGRAALSPRGRLRSPPPGAQAPRPSSPRTPARPGAGSPGPTAARALALVVAAGSGRWRGASAR